MPNSDRDPKPALKAQPGPTADPVLVTGGAGFIGSRVVESLLKAGARVVVLDDLSSGRRAALPPSGPLFRFVEGDARRAQDWHRAADGLGAIECVLHLAGTVGVRTVLNDPEACRAAHNAMAEAGIAWMQDRADRRSIRWLCASSSEVYLPSTEPLSEISPVLEPSDSRWGQGRFAYATSKREVEAKLDHAGLAATHLRLFNVVGPQQRAQSGMVLPRFIEAVRRGETPPVYGTGLQVRTFGHVRPIAEDIAQLCLRPAPAPGPLNLGGTAVATILELAQVVLRQAGRSEAIRQTLEPLRELGPNFAEVQHRVPDLSLAKGLGLVQAPWTLERIVQDAWQKHVAPEAAALEPSERAGEAQPPRPPSSSQTLRDAHRPHSDAPQSWRSRAAGSGQ